MSIQKYISDLLYRYECVIVPNFGGFVSNIKSAKIHSNRTSFYPPSKQLSFNTHLKNNDGLLANYIASSMDVPYEAAVNFINSEVNSWNAILDKDILELEHLGTLSKNSDNKIVFEPSNKVNYLTSSFGLSTFNSPAVKRLEYKETAEKVIPVISIKEENKKIPLFLKYAATIAIIATLGTFSWNAYQNNMHQQELIASERQQEKVTERIQKATFEIPDNLPFISLNITKEIRNFHVVAGAFREPLNAKKKVDQLVSKGFNAKIIGTNKWNLTVVTYNSYAGRKEALKGLRHIKKTVSKEAWLLAKEF